MPRVSELLVIRVIVPKDSGKSSLIVRNSAGAIIPSEIVKEDTLKWDFVLPNKGFRKGFAPSKTYHVWFFCADLIS